jgi:hypothetical protein
MSDAQLVKLRDRGLSVRKRWGFEIVGDDPHVTALWLPSELLSTVEELKFGNRYETGSGDFSVDVAEFRTSEWSLERLKNFHCCQISSNRKLEQPIADHAGPPKGFSLSATDGNKRISVRAFEKDDKIRLLAITYGLERDKEFRILRNAIISGYRPF